MGAPEHLLSRRLTATHVTNNNITSHAGAPTGKLTPALFKSAENCWVAWDITWVEVAKLPNGPSNLKW